VIESTLTLTPALSTPTLTPTSDFEPRLILSTQALTTTYSVQSADTFFNIAGRFRTDLEKLLAVNRKTCSDRPSMGVDVLIPGASDECVCSLFPLFEGNFDQAVEQLRLPCVQNITASAFKRRYHAGLGLREHRLRLACWG
jgi:hypothetical protein